MPRTASKWERLFSLLWEEIGGRPYVAEYPFAKPRRFRFDAAWPDLKCAVEFHGMTWGKGRHNRGKGLQSDCEKMRIATLAGWRVLAYTDEDLRERTDCILDEITKLLNSPAKG